MKPHTTSVVAMVLLAYCLVSNQYSVAHGDTIKIGLLGTYTNNTEEYKIARLDFEIHSGIAAALDQGVRDGRLPAGDTFELLVRNIPFSFYGASSQATDLIYNEEVLATAGVYYNGASDAFNVGNSTSPATPMIGGVGTDPITFFGAKALSAINYRVSFSEEAIQMVNLAINSKMRCKKFAIVFFYDPSVAPIGAELLGLLTERGFKDITYIAYGNNSNDVVFEAAKAVESVMGGAGNGIPTCIFDVADAAFNLNFAVGIAAHASYVKGEMFIIAPSVATFPDYFYPESVRGLMYTIQQHPHPEDTTWLFVQKYRSAMEALQAEGGFQHNVTTLANSNETVNIYTDPEVYSYYSVEGYMVGRMLLEIFTRMPKPYSRQGIMDVVYGSGFFKIDDLVVGPFADGCVGKRATEGSSIACVCNQGNKILYTSFLNESGVTVQYIADENFTESASVTKNEMGLGDCAFDGDLVIPPSTFLIPVDTAYVYETYAVSEHFLTGNLDGYIAELVEYHEMVVYTLAYVSSSGISRSTAGAMVPLLELHDNITAALPTLLERYSVTAIVAGAHRASSPVADIVLIASDSRGVYELEEPHVMDFERNRLRTDPVLADYITTTVKHFRNELNAKRAKAYTILILTETAQELAIVQKALWTEQISGFSEQVISTGLSSTTVAEWLEANYGSSVLTEADATVVIFLASQYGTSVKAAVGFAAAHSTTVELHLATGEEFIDSAVGSLSAETKAAWTTNNVFFASNIEPYWAPDYSDDQSITGTFHGLLSEANIGSASWPKLRAFRMAAFLFRAQDAILTVVYSADFINLWYSQGTVSSFGESLGPFYDTLCSLEVNESNTVDRSCQCNKGPHAFFVHSVRDWALNVDIEDLSSNYIYTISTCGVSYEPLEVPSQLLVWVLSIAGFVVVAITGIIIGLVFLFMPKKRDLSAAPKDQTKPFAMAFTDIQSSTNLWARLPEKMGEAVDAHHEIIRGLIRKHKGYEVKTIGDSFMVAFTKTQSAIEFAVGLQYEFYNHDWGHRDIDDVYRQLAEEKLAEQEEEEVNEETDSQSMLQTTDTGGTPLEVTSPYYPQSQGTPGSPGLNIPQIPVVTPIGIVAGSTSFETALTGRNTAALHRHLLDHISDPKAWNGLRVRVGIHHGFGEIKFDKVSLGYDYYGTVVNTAARVEGVGNGGQVLVTGPAYDDVTNGTHEVPIPDISISDMGPQPLRGLDEPVVLHQVLPVGLAGRQFAALRLDIERDIETEDETSGTDGTDGNTPGNSTQADSLITPEILAERYARRIKGDRYHATYENIYRNYSFAKAMLSTSVEKKKTEMVEHWAHKWRISLKTSIDKKMTSKMQFERHLMQLTIKVSPTVDTTKMATSHQYLNMSAFTGTVESRGSQGSHGPPPEETPTALMEPPKRTGKLRRVSITSPPESCTVNSGRGPTFAKSNSQPGSRHNRKPKVNNGDKYQIDTTGDQPQGDGGGKQQVETCAAGGDSASHQNSEAPMGLVPEEGTKTTTPTAAYEPSDHHPHEGEANGESMLPPTVDDGM